MNTSFANKRREKIDRIVSFLNETMYGNLYAVTENITFFKATRSLIQYIYWLIFHAPKIKSSELLELADFPFPEAQYDFYPKMIEMEKKKFPGLVQPLVDEIKKHIINCNKKILLLSVGSGGMEVERQILESLKDYANPVLIVAIDNSTIANEFAMKNLENCGVQTELFDKITSKEVLNKFNSIKKSEVIITQNDIFEMESDFSGCTFDISYSSLFLHHLSKEQNLKLKKIILKISNFHIDYDGYRSWIQMIPQSIIGWSNPVFLNSEIFSNLRFVSKKDLKNTNTGNSIRFLPIGHYMVKYDYSFYNTKQ